MRGKTWLYFLNKTEEGYSIRLDNFGLANYTGLVSALFIILLLIISNDYMLRKLKPGVWKNIQRLAYLLFVFAIVHCVYYRIVLENLNLIFYFYKSYSYTFCVSCGFFYHDKPTLRIKPFISCCLCYSIDTLCHCNIFRQVGHPSYVGCNSTHPHHAGQKALCKTCIQILLMSKPCA